MRLGTMTSRRGRSVHDFELRLVGHPSEPGQILAQDMVNLASSAQTLITRIARAAADRRGPGRSEAALEQLSRVRVTRLSEGSTTVSFAFGDAEALDFDDPISHEIDETFWLIAEGMKRNRRPADVTDSTAAAVDELIGASRHAAPVVEVRSHDRSSVELRPESVDREVWQSSLNTMSTRASYIGVLEMLDLRNGRFRIADDVANRIVLKDVHAPHDAAPAGRSPSPRHGTACLRTGWGAEALGGCRGRCSGPPTGLEPTRDGFGCPHGINTEPLT